MDSHDIAHNLMRYLPADYRGVAAQASKAWYCAFMKLEPELCEYIYAIYCETKPLRCIGAGDTIFVVIDDCHFALYMGKHRNIDRQVRIGDWWMVEMWFDRLVAECQRHDITPRTIKNILAYFCGRKKLKRVRQSVMERLHDDCFEAIAQFADGASLQKLRHVSVGWNRAVSKLSAEMVPITLTPEYGVKVAGATINAFDGMVPDSAAKLLFNGRKVCDIARYGAFFAVFGAELIFLSRDRCGIARLVNPNGADELAFRARLSDTGITVEQFKNTLLLL